MIIMKIQVANTLLISVSNTWIFSQGKQQKSIYPGKEELKEILGKRNKKYIHK